MTSKYPVSPGCASAPKVREIWRACSCSKISAGKGCPLGASQTWTQTPSMTRWSSWVLRGSPRIRPLRTKVTALKRRQAFGPPSSISSNEGSCHSRSTSPMRCQVDHAVAVQLHDGVVGPLGREPGRAVATEGPLLPVAGVGEGFDHLGDKARKVALGVCGVLTPDDVVCHERHVVATEDVPAEADARQGTSCRGSCGAQPRPRTRRRGTSASSRRSTACRPR
jgi:hypothetical protein